MKNKCKICSTEIIIDEDLGEFAHLASIVQICSNECKLINQQIQWDKEAQERYNIVSDCFPGVHEGAQLTDFENINEDWIETANGKASAFKYVKRWVESDYWLLFLQSSESDTGKTRLGLVALAEEARHGNTFRANLNGVGYEKAYNLASYLASERLKAKKPITEAYKYCSILMIDELGDEGDSKSYETRALSNLLQIREENKLRTIVTTNLSRDDIPTRYGARLYSRIKKGILNKQGIARR